ncbi:2Fe-2S iron-sulfur cluster binding domain-containing protein [Ruegeria pomeroyi]|uniref:2Fe-2S iron-sulfur cluster binding domain-containing protein n=2 Tax=Ruegeria TaxID=97050 RepID=A0A9Q3ZS34_9RHOB|nr:MULTISPECIES: 2Fe-2S iron-sulfur cluster-binding protein [Ruegeria]MCE8539687.1 2Fe-2S iron-sulfur cluster binding domain-containing protein [Ruegeria pomeroyi]MCV2887866.1 2Fe-2S iron-sulfur cluster-binding protein [Ruegeria sp. XHP0148]
MRVTWKLADGREIAAEVAPGLSLMEAAQANNVPGVIGECGGCLSCATCHVVVDPAWSDRTGAPGEFEDAMLDITAAERQPRSRLSCQIEAHPDLDGLVLHVPEA